jgi:hypothetical protein
MICPPLYARTRACFSTCIQPTSAGTKALVRLTPFDLVGFASLGIDGGVLAFTLVVTMATCFLFGLVPALHASRVDLIESLKHGGARLVTAGRAVRARGVLVVAEIALAFVLLTSAGLLMKSLMALHKVELGYRPENRLVMRASGVRSTQENTVYFGEVLTRVAALPGVVAAGAAMVRPGDLANSGSGSYFSRSSAGDSRPDDRSIRLFQRRGARHVLGVRHSADARPGFPRLRHTRSAHGGHRQRSAGSKVARW